MNDKLYLEFLNYLDCEDKEKAVKLIVDEFEKIKDLSDFAKIYTNILSRALNEMQCKINNKHICIWKEHVRSSIIRTILECAYPCIIDLKNKQGITESKGTAIIICPDGEYHEIGARMVADYFTIAGFNAIYVGSSTPKEEFIYAINEINPKVLAISVTNYFNIVSAKSTIDVVRKTAKDIPLIVVGGNAFINNPNVKEIGADLLLNSYEDILKLAKEVK